MAVALLGCGTSYAAGDFTDRGRRVELRHRSFECVDVRLQPYVDRTVGSRFLAIDYEIGNRCLSPARVDFRAVTVFGQFDREMAELPLHDWRGEIVEATLDGRAYAREALAYQPPGATVDPLERVCIDLNGLADGDPVEPVCFAEENASLKVEQPQWEGMPWGHRREGR